MKNPYKEFAQKFLPYKIRYLLIGESPPYTPPNEELRYFYNYKNIKNGQILLSSVCYSFLDRKFYNKINDKKEFLIMLMGKGIFLIDATYEPVNHIKNKKVRLAEIVNSYPQLTKTIKDLHLKQDAKVLLIHKNVIKVIGEKLRQDFKTWRYKFYDIGFPRYYNDDKFKNKIIEVLRESNGVENQKVTWERETL